MSPLVFVGIDVSLTSLDLALRPGASSSLTHDESVTENSVWNHFHLEINKKADR